MANKLSSDPINFHSFGNKVRSATTAGGETRCNIDTAVYDSTGRYVDTTYDCLGRKTSQVVSRDSYGNPLEVRSYTNTAGTSYVTSYYRYTARGIQYFEASSAGAWQANTLHAGTGSLCPTGTVFYSKALAAGGSESRECFDKLGRTSAKLQKGFNGSWVLSKTEYDALGRVVNQSEPYYSGGSVYWTKLSYDPLGRVTQTVLPDNSDATVAYNGLTTVSTNDKNQTKTELKNVLGEMVQVTDHLGGTISYTYDAQGNLTQTTDNAANSTVITYDLLGRKTQMDDPDKGQWSYDYNGFGELTQQTDALGQRIVMTYDSLGRMVTRKDYRTSSSGSLEGDATWVYDTAPYGLGQLDYVTDADSGYLKAVEYDTLGRPSKTVTSLGISGAEGDHYEKVTYDQYGRTFQVFDAARNDDTYTDNGVEHRYNSDGYLYQLVDAVYVNGSTRSVFQQILSMDARGNVTSEKLANNVTTNRTFNAQTGRISTLQSTTLGGAVGDVQEHTYNWDTLGNLTSRIDQSGNKNLSETFGYDGLNRLTSHQVAGQSAKTVTYNSIGNITSKTGVGSYSYGAGNAGPHAVTDAGGVTYSYDANGNNTSSGDGRSISYTVFNKADTVTKGTHTTAFTYGPERSRYKRTDNNGSGIRTTLYIGSVEKITHIDGSKEVKRYIGGVIIETEDYASNGAFTGEEQHFAFKDHLGSMDVITDNTGSILTNGGELSFDPWGQRRSGVNWNDVNISQLIADYGVFSSIAPVTTRGFTGHEMVDEVGIIHMNGRIYDPVLGRFLQADPFIQSPSDTQMYNRYSYTRNNPLNATDPSGYIIPFVVAAIQIAAGALAVGKVITVAAAAWIAFGAGFVGTLLQGGDVFDALFSGVSGAAFTGIGASFGLAAKAVGGVAQLGMTTIAKYAGLMAVTGGITGSLQGGNFGNGFITSGVGFFIGAAAFGGIESITLRTTANMVLSGTISDVTGGKFANGAGMAAFGTVVSGAVGYSAQGQGFMRGALEFFKDVGYDLKYLADGLIGSQNVGTVYVEEIYAPPMADKNTVNLVVNNDQPNGYYSVAANHPGGGTDFGLMTQSAFRVGAYNMVQAEHAANARVISAGILSAYPVGMTAKITFNFLTSEVGKQYVYHSLEFLSSFGDEISTFRANAYQIEVRSGLLKHGQQAEYVLPGSKIPASSPRIPTSTLVE